MSPTPKSSPKSFAEIKKDLDPSYNYLIFRKQVESDRRGDFSEIIKILASLQIKEAEWHIYSDKSERRSILVVKIIHHPDQLTMQETLACKLSQDVGFSFYRKWP
jgi:hypothetical protein